MSVNQPGDVAYGFSQALIGVPNKPILAQRNPTTNDKAQIGTMWINQNFNEVYVLTSIVDNVATWVQADSSSAFNQVDADVGSAVPNMGILNAFGGANINTSASGNTLTINLNDNVDLPATNAGGTQGVYQIGGANFLFGYGPTNTFVGGNSGNTTLTVLSALRNVGVGNNSINSITTGANNTAVGVDALTTLNTGTNNVAVGYLSLTALTSGESNVAIGNQSLQNLVTGEDNIAIGFAAGSALNGAQSSNIYIANQGDVGDTNTIRIGTQGVGIGEQASCFIAGIAGVTPAGSTEFVILDTATGELGSTPDSGAIEELLADDGNTASGPQVEVTGGDNITTSADNASTLTISLSGTTDHALQIGNTAGSLTSLGVATDGQLPIGSTGLDPVLATLTAGTNINITNGAGSITIDSTVPQAIETIDGNVGTISGATVTIEGGNNITTTGDNATTMTVSVTGTTDHAIQVGNATGSLTSLAAATNGQLPIGSTGANPTIATLTQGAGINITNGAGSITIASTITQGITTLTTELAGGSATNSTVFVDAHTNSGSGVFFTAPATNSLQLNIGDANSNVLMGSQSGSLSVTGSNNTGVGVTCMRQVFGGNNNVAMGFGTLFSVNTSSDNTVIGHNSMNNLNAGAGGNTVLGSDCASMIVDGVENIIIGHSSGDSYTGTESSNILINHLGVLGESNVIRIGTQGSGAAQQNSCFIAGIGGVTPGGTPEFVIIDPATGELGSTSGGGGGGITTINGDAGSVTGSTVTFDAASNCGASWQFNGASTVMTLLVEDTNNSIFMGVAAGNLTATGDQNIGIGHACLLNITTATSNVAVGYNSMDTLEDADSNTALGAHSLGALQTGLGNNTACGFQALGGVVSGTNNIAIGSNAGGNYGSTESNNIDIGFGGNPGTSNQINIGNNGTHNSCFIQGIAGVTVANSAAVLVDTTTGEMGTIASSRRYKENIEDMEQESARILELRPVTFNYKNDPTREIHYGLIAEEVDGIIPELVTYNKDKAPETVRYHELPALLLNELQRQHAIIADLSRRLERLETRGTYESKT